MSSDGRVTVTKGKIPPLESHGVEDRWLQWNQAGTAACIEWGTGNQSLWLIRVEPQGVSGISCVGRVVGSVLLSLMTIMGVGAVGNRGLSGFPRRGGRVLGVHRDGQRPCASPILRAGAVKRSS